MTRVAAKVGPLTGVQRVQVCDGPNRCSIQPNRSGCPCQLALIRERQREEIALAKAKGVNRGRRRSLSPEHRGEQRSRLGRKYGISRETVCQYLRQDRADLTTHDG